MSAEGKTVDNLSIAKKFPCVTRSSRIQIASVVNGS